MKLDTTIKELEIQSEIMYNLSVDLKNKAVALRRELTKCGALVSSPSDEDFERRLANTLYKRKKSLLRK